MSHHEQRYPNSCVPACMCMIQTWRGEEATEDAFHEGGNPGGHGLRRVLGLPGTRALPASAPGDDKEIHLALRLGRRVVATVCGPRYVAWQEDRYPGLVSRHGALCAPGDWGAPLHAVLLVGRTDDGYELLDPWFPAAEQPLRMDDDTFQRCFAGPAVTADPKPEEE